MPSVCLFVCLKRGSGELNPSLLACIANCITNGVTPISLECLFNTWALWIYLGVTGGRSLPGRNTDCSGHSLPFFPVPAPDSSPLQTLGNEKRCSHWQKACQSPETSHSPPVGAAKEDATQLKYTCLVCPSLEFHPGTNTKAWSQISEFKNQNGADEVVQNLRAVATFSVWFLTFVLGSSRLPAMPVP